MQNYLYFLFLFLYIKKNQLSSCIFQFWKSFVHVIKALENLPNFGTAIEALRLGLTTHFIIRKRVVE